MQAKRVARWTLVAIFAAVYTGAAGAAGGGGGAPLVAAVRNGDVETVRVLLKGPNSANVAEADGTTALHVATDRDDLASVQHGAQCPFTSVSVDALSATAFCRPAVSASIHD